jgi:hypothetical protein
LVWVIWILVLDSKLYLTLLLSGKAKRFIDDWFDFRCLSLVNGVAGGLERFIFNLGIS